MQAIIEAPHAESVAAAALLAGGGWQLTACEIQPSGEGSADGGSAMEAR